MAESNLVNGQIQYILLSKSGFKDEDWYIPDRKMFHAAVNWIEILLLTRETELVKTMAWSNMWGKIGLLGLLAEDMKRLTRFRQFVDNELIISDRRFKLYPKEALLRESEITLLLMNDLVSFPYELIPNALFCSSSSSSYSRLL